eukprot:COSAG02_NODE_24795_length_677_cov_1.243945_1_plen_38_part_10
MAAASEIFAGGASAPPCICPSTHEVFLGGGGIGGGGAG